MLDLLKIAVRNLARNWHRTFLTAGLITVGVLAVLLFTSLSGSFKSLMIGQFTYSIMGHLEIHAKGYVASIDPKTMEHVETALKSENNVVAYRPNHTLEQLAAMQ